MSHANGSLSKSQTQLHWKGGDAVGRAGDAGLWTGRRCQSEGKKRREDDDKAFSSCLIGLGEQAACQAWVGLLLGHFGVPFTVMENTGE